MDSGKEIPQLKCVVVGSSGVGKTALTNRLTQNKFVKNMQATIGIEYAETELDIDGQTVRLNVWDTAGQERFKSIAQKYFRSAICVLLVFDISNKQSFDDIEKWKKDVINLCDPFASIIIVGNKSDLAIDRVVSSAEAQQYADNNKLSYIETSALSGTNVREAFIRSAKEALSKASNLTMSAGQPELKPPQKESKGCC